MLQCIAASRAKMRSEKHTPYILFYIENQYLSQFIKILAEI